MVWGKTARHNYDNHLALWVCFAALLFRRTQLTQIISPVVFLSWLETLSSPSHYSKLKKTQLICLICQRTLMHWNQTCLNQVECRSQITPVTSQNPNKRNSSIWFNSEEPDGQKRPEKIKGNNKLIHPAIPCWCNQREAFVIKNITQSL